MSDLEAPPALGGDGGAKIVEAEKILGGCGNHAAASAAKARARSLRLQYQR